MNESLLDRALADLVAHPDSTAREVGRRIGVNSRDVFSVLDHAAYDGRCQRSRAATETAWRWEACPEGGSR